MAKNPVRHFTPVIEDESSIWELTAEELNEHARIEKELFPEGHLPTRQWRTEPRNSLEFNFTDKDLNADLLTLMNIAESQVRKRFKSFDDLNDCAAETEENCGEAESVWTEDQKVAWLYILVTNTLNHLGHSEPSKQLGELASVSALLANWLAFGIDEAMRLAVKSNADRTKKAREVREERSLAGLTKTAMAKKALEEHQRRGDNIMDPSVTRKIADAIKCDAKTVRNARAKLLKAQKPPY